MPSLGLLCAGWHGVPGTENATENIIFHILFIHPIPRCHLQSMSGASVLAEYQQAVMSVPT